MISEAGFTLPHDGKAPHPPPPPPKKVYFPYSYSHTMLGLFSTRGWGFVAVGRRFDLCILRFSERQCFFHSDACIIIFPALVSPLRSSKFGARVAVLSGFEAL